MNGTQNLKVDSEYEEDEDFNNPASPEKKQHIQNNFILKEE